MVLNPRDHYTCTESCCMSLPAESLPDFTRRALINHGLVKVGEDVVFVDNQPSKGPCHFCGKTAELRMGMCFACFTDEKV